MTDVKILSFIREKEFRAPSHRSTGQTFKHPAHCEVPRAYSGRIILLVVDCKNISDSQSLSAQLKGFQE